MVDKFILTGVFYDTNDGDAEDGLPGIVSIDSDDGIITITSGILGIEVRFLINEIEAIFDAYYELIPPTD